MTTIVPEPQPSQPAIQTVKEYNLDPKCSLHVVAIHDGWRPLGICSLEHSLLLLARVDTGAPEEPEIFHLLYHGDDLGAIEEKRDVDLAFIGRTWNGMYLFLEVKREFFDPAEAPARKLGRMDLED